MISQRTFARFLLCSVALGPLFLSLPARADQDAKSAKPKPVQCSALAAYVRAQAGEGLNLNPISPSSSLAISSTTPVTSTVVPAAGTTVSYCQVAFQLEPAITIEVGLPLNAMDGGTGVGCSSTTVANNGCVEGNWNGKLEAIGNGGYSGSVPSVTGATNVGFAGSSTDNGHSSNWCNATNPKTGSPNAEANCGIAGGGFVLDAKDNLNTTAITDFIDTSEVEQTVWLQRLAKVYYGTQPKRTYWNGCSTGGRQGMQMAQFHPELFDGILAGAPAFNWNRFIIGEMWPPIVVADIDPSDCASGTSESCSAGLSTAFQNAYTAANSAAVAACDANDGVTDGVVNEPRLCIYDAKALVGKSAPPMTSPMTLAQAQAINMIWDGPRNLRGERLWGGITRGTSFATLTGAFSTSLITTYVYNWLVQDPNFDIIANINTMNFATYFEQSDIKFADTHEQQKGSVVPAATDRIDLDALADNGTKLLHYRGTNDPLIVPFGSWNYDSRLFEKYGVRKTEKFYRSFYYPGNGHCGGNTGFANAGLVNSGDLFNALIDWVENDKAPDSIVAYTGAADTGNTTLICSNPNRTVYNGGPTTSASSYSCTKDNQEPEELAEFDQTAKQYHEAP
jgi:hypothetical protein